MWSNYQAKLLCAAAALTGLLTIAAGAGQVWAHEAHDHGSHDDTGHDHAAGAAASGPHSGQVSVVGDLQFEVFYAAQETRVFVYDARRQPVSDRGMRGELIMRVRGNDQVYRFPLSYAQTQGEDFLVARVDVSRVRDGDMQVTFDLQGLPSRAAPAARFTQQFALSRQPLAVTVARLTQADQAGVARQRICPVMDVQLGEDGPPIKLLVGGQPLYVCCDDCVDAVRKNSERDLAMLRGGATPQGAASPALQFSVSYATAEDNAAIRAQGRCVVMTEQQLGDTVNRSRSRSTAKRCLSAVRAASARCSKTASLTWPRRANCAAAVSDVGSGESCRPQRFARGGARPVFFSFLHFLDNKEVIVMSRCLFAALLLAAAVLTIGAVGCQSTGGGGYGSDGHAGHSH